MFNCACNTLCLIPSFPNFISNCVVEKYMLKAETCYSQDTYGLLSRHVEAANRQKWGVAEKEEAAVQECPPEK